MYIIIKMKQNYNCVLTKLFLADIVILEQFHKLKIDREAFTMVSVNILLNTINDVKNFVNIVSKYEFEVDLTSGRYVIDAKSIMGIFSLDLSKSIKLDARCDPDSKFLTEIAPFIVK